MRKLFIYWHNQFFIRKMCNEALAECGSPFIIDKKEYKLNTLASILIGVLFEFAIAALFYNCRFRGEIVFLRSVGCVSVINFPLELSTLLRK